MDDSLTYQKLLGGFLSRMGYDITLSSTSRDALLKLNESAFDLVMFTADPADMDLLSFIKRLKVNHDLTLCLMSSQDHEEERTTAQRESVSVALIKPFQYHTLRKTVEGLIGPALPKG